jgi:hypothetical protein
LHASAAAPSRRPEPARRRLKFERAAGFFRGSLRPRREGALFYAPMSDPFHIAARALRSGRRICAHISECTVLKG